MSHRADRRLDAPPPIVVMAYNRPDALQRLLDALSNGVYSQAVPLIIVADTGGEHSEAVRQLAHRFAWPFGEKKVHLHAEPQGLFQNFLFCGDLTRQYGHIVLLEDDLYVSPHFYSYVETVRQALVDPTSKVAGISLSGPWFNGFTHYRFNPLEDGASTYYMQIAWYHGQYYTAAQWEGFRSWQASSSGYLPYPFHELFETFPETDWFPVKTAYLVATDRYYLFPRVAHATNFGDMGTHFEQGTRFFQTPVQWGNQPQTIHAWDEALAIYDSFQEILPERLNRLTNRYQTYPYVVDLNGTKSRKNLNQPYLLTTKRSQAPLESFGDVMQPLEANVVAGVPGDGIHFTHVDALDLSWRRETELTWRRYRHHARGREVGQRTRLRRLIGRWLSKGFT